MDLSYLPVQQPELEGFPRAHLSLRDVFILYRQQFWTWFAITAPTSLTAAWLLFMANQRASAIFRSIPRGQNQYHFAKVAEAAALQFGSFSLSWFLGCFALGAIATAVSHLDSEDEAVWRRDSHQRAREHFGQLFLIAAFTFGAFLVGMAVIGFIDFALIRAVGWRHLLRLKLEAAVLGFVIVSSIVSWFGMAIPLVLRGNIRVWDAIKKSVEISNGYEGFLFLLVIESVVGSYVAWYAAHYGLALVFPASLRFTEWYGWLVYIVVILASAAVQPPMFIGFALLADVEQPSSALFPGSQQSPNVH